MLVVGVIVLNIVITIILLTTFLYYYNLSFECDAYPSFPCQTDWKCSGYAETDDENVVLVNANGYGITNAMMGCYLNALYGYNGVDGNGNNEFGNECQYIADKSGNRTKILPRAQNILSDRNETINGVVTSVAAGCNDDNNGILQDSINPFGAVCKPGAYQNIYLRPGNTPVGTPYDNCDPNEDWCVNIAELLCSNPNSLNNTQNYFSGIVKSCDGT